MRNYGQEFNVLFFSTRGVARCGLLLQMHSGLSVYACEPHKTAEPLEMWFGCHGADWGGPNDLFIKRGPGHL